MIISNVICYLQHCIYCWLLLREAFSFFFTSHYHCYNDLIAVSVCACVFADAAACDWRSIDYVWFVQLKAALLRWVCGSRGVRSVYQWRWLGAVGGRLIVAAIVFVSVLVCFSFRGVVLLVLICIFRLLICFCGGSGGIIYIRVSAVEYYALDIYSLLLMLALITIGIHREWPRRIWSGIISSPE